MTMKLVGDNSARQLSQRRRHGFTIVELLVVIVIIGILAAITVVAYGNIQQRSRDAVRLQDARTIEKALVLYRAQTGTLFGPTSVDGSWETSFEDGPGDFMETLVSSSTLSKVPIDPQNTGARHYRYYLYPAGTSGCDTTRGTFAVLQIIDLETSPRPYAGNPGFSCSGRDWSTEADYTFGMYLNG